MRRDPAHYIAAGIDRLSTMQVDSGGFSFWPNGDTPYPWGSVYATHFLVEARRAGYPVDGTLYDRAIGFVQRDAQAQESYSAAALQETVYALYVLARAGKPDVGTMDFVRERHVGGAARRVASAPGRGLCGRGQPARLRGDDPRGPGRRDARRRNRGATSTPPCATAPSS
jgi:hypothetical protein